MVERIISFLLNRLWTVARDNGEFTVLIPPANFNFQQEFELTIPKQTGRVDSAQFLNNILEIIADLYDLTSDDLNVIIGSDNTVLKVRIYDDQTESGRMPLKRFEELIDKIKSILSDTASFVIDKSIVSNRIPVEVSRFLHLCNFMQTERGSFVAKIQLPSKEIIKEREILDREEVYSEDINSKLNEILAFIKANIFEGDINPTEDYVLENEEVINIRLFRNVKQLFEKTDSKNIDFSFHNINYSKVIENRDINRLKLYKLDQFVDRVESFTFETGPMNFTGHIIALKSKNPDGSKNGITFTGIFNNLPIVATANLDSIQYRDAIEAHKTKKHITISGIARRTKVRAKFLNVENLIIEE